MPTSDITGKFLQRFGLVVLVLVPFDASHAAGYRVVHTFMGGNDGANPVASVTMDKAGNLYGTTPYGGGGSYRYCGDYGCGIVFKVAPDGTETVLYAFAGGNDGTFPWAPVIADASGNLYGTASGGGAYDWGTVFKLEPDGTFTVLHSFGGGVDGGEPLAGLIADGKGNLYGTTAEGGGSSQCAGGCGTIFKLAPDGTETVLHAFAGGSDGASPVAGLIADSEGNFYGTTRGGGGTDCYEGFGCGTVFKQEPDGTETVLHAFTGGGDGVGPVGPLIANKSGDFFGTTYEGGGSRGCQGNGCGTFFKVAPDGTETVLHSFGGSGGGAYPECGLVADSEGTLYGTTLWSGTNNGGTVFAMTQGGTETVLYSFTRGEDGGHPAAGLMRNHAGQLFGTTESGGGLGCSDTGGGGSCGVVFMLKK